VGGFIWILFTLLLGIPMYAGAWLEGRTTH
jgi:hypothetical protein